MRTFLACLIVFCLGLGAAFFIAAPSGNARAAVDGTITGGVAAGAPSASLLSLSTTSVPAGTYEFDITDSATTHNFDICPGSNRCTTGTSLDKTSISGTSSVVWDIALTPGKYTYQCDMHSNMTKHFTVTGTGTTTTGTTSTTGTTQTTPAKLSVRIVSTKAKRSGVTVTAVASQLSRVTGVLLRKGRKVASAAKDGTRVTLRFKKSLAPGRYVVKVTVKCCGRTATAKKTVRVR
jgi:hypothetical protein